MEQFNGDNTQHTVIKSSLWWLFGNSWSNLTMCLQHDTVSFDGLFLHYALWKKKSIWFFLVYFITGIPRHFLLHNFHVKMISVDKYHYHYIIIIFPLIFISIWIFLYIYFSWIFLQTEFVSLTFSVSQLDALNNIGVDQDVYFSNPFH